MVEPNIPSKLRAFVCLGVNKLCSSKSAFTYAVSSQSESNHGAFVLFGAFH